MVIDRQWDVVLANAAAQAMVDGLPDHLLGPPLNVFRVYLHPDGLAARTRNLSDWAGYLLHQIDRTVRLTGDPRLAEIAAEVRGYANVAALADQPLDGDPPLLVPVVVDIDGTDVANVHHPHDVRDTA